MPRPLLDAHPTQIASEAGRPLQLPLFGPARLEWHGNRIRLRRKSVAILYYLAIEGATRRQVLADLLWERIGSSQNLRVELHHLRKTLAEFGVSSFEGSSDPLSLPAGVQLDSNGEAGDPLEGLEDLSPMFQAWLEEQRATVGPRTAGLVHRDVVEEVARGMRLPYLLILSAEPDSGQDAFVSSLARRLGLRRSEEVSGQGRALRYLSSFRRFEDGVVQRIVEDDDNLWVVEQPQFGEDSAFLLRLRGSYPADRMSYLKLPPLTWREFRSQVRPASSFGEAAELYSQTGGNPGYLRELPQLRKSRRAGERALLPQRVRAAYQLEARHLSLDARFALERASVHPGPLATGLLRALEVEPHLIELERRNWLVLEDDWRFRGNVSRTAIYLSLSKGQSRHYHLRAAEHLEAAGRSVAAEYHRSLAGGQVDWRRVAETLEGWSWRVAGERSGRPICSDPSCEHLSLREESPLLESRSFGEQVEAQSGEAVIVRQPLEVGSSGVEWQLLIPDGVLHLRGRAYVRNSLDVGLDGDATPLELEFLGPVRRSVVYAPVERAQTLENGTLLLPLSEELDSYLRFEDALFVRLSSSAEAAVVEVTLTVHSAIPAGTDRGVSALEPPGLLGWR